MNFSDRLTYLIDNLCDGNAKKFANETGIPYTSVQEYSKGKNQDPKLSLINKIIKIYENVNPLWLITGEGQAILNDVYLNVYQDVYLKEKNMFNEPMKKYEKKCPQCVIKDERINDLNSIINNLNDIISDLREDKAYLRDRLKRIEQGGDDHSSKAG